MRDCGVIARHTPTRATSISYIRTSYQMLVTGTAVWSTCQQDAGSCLLTRQASPGLAVPSEEVPISDETATPRHKILAPPF